MAEQKNPPGISLQDLLTDSGAGPDTSKRGAMPSQIPASVVNLEVSGIQLDSRKVQPGDVFIAVPGFDENKPSDGRHFIHQAIAAGAVAVFAEQEGWPAISMDEYAVPLVSVPGLSAQLSAIAGRFYGRPGQDLRVIGVTGTNGKTSCCYLLGQLFNRLEVRTAVIGTLGYGVPGVGQRGMTQTGLTTPDAVASQAILADMLASKVACVAMEVSSHSLDQGRVNDVGMTGAVFTNLSQDHLDYHGSMKDYLAAKQKLFEMPGLEFAVINVDDPAGLALCQALGSDVQRYTFSLSDPTQSVAATEQVPSQGQASTGASASVYANNIRSSLNGVEADIVSPWGRAHIHSRLIGEFNLSNILAVITVACASGLRFAEVIDALAALKPVPGRLEVISDGSWPRVLIDYAHTPDALSKTLSALRFANPDLAAGAANQPAPETNSEAGVGGRLWCVFGCGGDRDQGKRPVMGSIANDLADEVVVTSDNPRNEAPGAIIDAILSKLDPADGRVHRIEDRAQAIRFAISQAGPKDTVVIAGKGHEDYQICGDRRLPFSDALHARLALRSKAGDSE